MIKYLKNTHNDQKKYIIKYENNTKTAWWAAENFNSLWMFRHSCCVLPPRRSFLSSTTVFDQKLLNWKMLWLLLLASGSPNNICHHVCNEKTLFIETTTTITTTPREIQMRRRRDSVACDYLRIATENQAERDFVKVNVQKMNKNANISSERRKHTWSPDEKGER